MTYRTSTSRCSPRAPRGAGVAGCRFQRPLAWKILDSIIALIMFGISARLLVAGVTMLVARLNP
jgi:hypothetical protein